MTHALVIFEAPKGAVPKVEHAWRQAYESAKDKTSKSGKVEVLNESCFLCDLSSGLLDLSTVVATASAFGLQTRTLFFEVKPAFVISRP